MLSFCHHHPTHTRYRTTTITTITKSQVYEPEDDEDRGFGLLGDSDHLWTPDERERQKHQVGRGIMQEAVACWCG